MTRPGSSLGAGSRELLFTYDFPPMRGGMARWMDALARNYPAGSLVVSTGTLPGAETIDATYAQRIDRVAVHAEKLRTLTGQFVWSRRATELARDPAVHFAWCDTVRPSGYPARWAFRRAGLPYGIMVVGGDLLTFRVAVQRSAFKRRVMRSILRHAAVFVAISHWTADLCRDVLREMDLDDAAARVRVVTLGTDPASWHRDGAAAAAFRVRRGLPQGRWLVTVARLVNYKGIDTAIRAVAFLAGGFPDLQYAVIGSGPEEGALRALCRELGVADRVHFLTDVNDTELNAAYSLGEIYVGLTQRTRLDVEGFGLSFVEAAACELPVVATRSGGIPDAVSDGSTGLLVEPRDVAAATAAINRILDSPDVGRQWEQPGAPEWICTRTGPASSPRCG